MDIIIYLLLGCFAGFVAGLLGVGGGLIIVPILAWVFAAGSMASESVMHMAVGSSLATIIFTSLSSIRAHHLSGALDWKLAIRLSPGLVFGALLGAYIAHHINTGNLKLFFGLFELWVAIQMSLDIRAKASRQLPGKTVLSFVSTGIGTISSIVGIGGGTLTVPFLIWCNVKMQNAVAVSAACGFPIAVAGMIGFILMGMQTTLPHTLGYVYLPAVGFIIITSILFAPLGAKLAHRMPAQKLKRVFSLLLYCLAIKMLLF